MKILDRYIVKKYIGTLSFMLLLLSIIVVVIDVQSKSPRIEESGHKVGDFLLHYYPFWMIYLLITFMSVLVFITVIFFTSKLANNTEIVSYISSGASFHRFARPYFYTSFAIALFALVTNHFILPWANIKKNELGIYTENKTNRDKQLGNVSISTQLTKTEYIFINSYNRKDRRGSGYLYQKFDQNRKITQQISASEVNWDLQKKVFVLSNYTERNAGLNDTDILAHGETRTQDFKSSPEELFPDQLLGENKTTPELMKFINREKEKGNANINTYQNELYQRTSMPVSIIILSFLALSLSSEKRRGGLGINLAIGIALAFVFVFSFEVLKVVSESKTLPPLLAMWLPNLIFGPLTVYLYLKRAHQ